MAIDKSQKIYDKIQAAYRAKFLKLQKQLEREFNKIADEFDGKIQRLVYKYAKPDGTFDKKYIDDINREIDAIADWFTKTNAAWINKNIIQSAEFAIDSMDMATKAFIQAAAEAYQGKGREILTKAATDPVAPFLLRAQFGTGLAEQVRDAVWKRRWIDGWALSDRIWETDRVLRKNLHDMIEQCVNQGLSAVEFSRSVEKYLKEPGRAWTTAIKPSVTGRGSIKYNALRLARNETNVAYKTGHILGAKNSTIVKGIKWNLSRSHPERDICCLPGTMIATAKGLKAIEKVSVGEMVYTHTGCLQKVERVYCRDIKDAELVRLQFLKGSNRILELVLTLNHPVLTDEGWTPAGDLKTGCRGYSFALKQIEPLYRWVHGVDRTTLSNFVESENKELLQTNGGELYDERCQQACHKSRKPEGGFPAPITSPLFAFGISRYRDCHPSRRGCFCLSGIWKALCELPQSAGTSLVAFFRSSGCFRLCGGHTHENSIKHFSGRAQRFYRKFCTQKKSQHDPLGNIRLNKTYGSADSLEHKIPYHKLHNESNCAWRSHETGQNTNDCKNDALQNALGVQFRRPLGQAVFRTIRRFSYGISSYLRKIFHVNYNMGCRKVPLHLIGKEIIKTKRQTVYNLKVEKDNSYIANGLVVHNCDEWATQNLYGLGPGVYPIDKVPPGHVQCMCYLTDVLYTGQELIDRLKEKYKS